MDMKMILLRRGLEQPNHNEKHYCNDNTDDENAFDGYEYDSSKERPGPETVYRGCFVLDLLQDRCHFARFKH